MTSYLDELLARAHERVRAARAELPLAALRGDAAKRPDPPGLRAALLRPGVGVIAEIKRASPSRGELAPELDAARQARAYADAGAAAISVLTEPSGFAGSLADLQVASQVGTPTLRKDFLVDPYQVWEARLAGASAVLLIVAALDDATLRALAAEARSAGLDTLVEIHDAAELPRALEADADVIGINARDLRTFDVDRSAFGRLRPGIPDGVPVVAESGVRGPEDVRRAAAEGADAVLVGESAVTSDDPRAFVAELVAAGGGASMPRGEATA